MVRGIAFAGNQGPLNLEKKFVSNFTCPLSPQDHTPFLFHAFVPPDFLS